jgi:hypothetical protein
MVIFDHHGVIVTRWLDKLELWGADPSWEIGNIEALKRLGWLLWLTQGPSLMS